jgi:hypothetical protein
MSESEWLACEEPDMMLEALEGKVPHELLVVFVRQCWHRITPYLPVQNDVTVVEEFAALAQQQSDHDAVLYAAEAVLKAARWAPNIRAEQKQQAALLRRLVGRPS